MEDMLSVLPFGGTFDLMQLKGSTLRRAFEFSVRRYGQGTGEFLQVSGIDVSPFEGFVLGPPEGLRLMMFPTGFHVVFDISRPPGSRVRSISILCTKCRVPHYEPLEDEMVYTVVVPSYLVTGGDGFFMIRDEALKHNSGETFVLCCW